jgi:hypothetical protein
MVRLKGIADRWTLILLQRNYFTSAIRLILLYLQDCMISTDVCPLFLTTWTAIKSLFLFLEVGWDWIQLVHLSLFGLLYQPRMMMNVEQLVIWELAGETEVLGENQLLCHFVHQKSNVSWPGLEPGPPRREPTTDLLSYGTAHKKAFLSVTAYESQLLLLW